MWFYFLLTYINGSTKIEWFEMTNYETPLTGTIIPNLAVKDGKVVAPIGEYSAKY